MTERPQVVMGGIINHKQGVGFKITFIDKIQAQKYKDMFRWILLDDNMNVVTNLGYHDSKEDNYR